MGIDLTVITHLFNWPTPRIPIVPFYYCRHPAITYRRYSSGPPPGVGDWDLCLWLLTTTIPIIFRRYFYFTNQHDALELVDLYSDVKNDPTQPRTLQELAVIMAREQLKFWSNYRMSIFRYHYCDFVRLQHIFLTTMGIPLAVSKLALPSLREPRYAVHFSDTFLLHKSPAELFFEICAVTQASSMVSTQITLVLTSFLMSTFYGLTCLPSL